MFTTYWCNIDRLSDEFHWTRSWGHKRILRWSRTICVRSVCSCWPPLCLCVYTFTKVNHRYNESNVTDYTNEETDRQTDRQSDRQLGRTPSARSTRSRVHYTKLHANTPPSQWLTTLLDDGHKRKQEFTTEKWLTPAIIHDTRVNTACRLSYLEILPYCGLWWRFADTYNCIKVAFRDTDILGDILAMIVEIDLMIHNLCNLTR